MKTFGDLAGRATDGGHWYKFFFYQLLISTCIRSCPSTQLVRYSYRGGFHFDASVPFLDPSMVCRSIAQCSQAPKKKVDCLFGCSISGSDCKRVSLPTSLERSPTWYPHGELSTTISHRRPTLLHPCESSKLHSRSIFSILQTSFVLP